MFKLEAVVVSPPATEDSKVPLHMAHCAWAETLKTVSKIADKIICLTLLMICQS